MNAQAVEAEKAKEASSSKHTEIALNDVPTPPAETVSSPATSTNENRMPDTPTPAGEASSPATLEERVRELRREVERIVKSPGAALKSAPFHTASTIQSLPPGAQVLIVISTPYWFGVETHNGQHGWILRDELELVP